MRGLGTIAACYNWRGMEMERFLYHSGFNQHRPTPSGPRKRLRRAERI